LPPPPTSSHFTYTTLFRSQRIEKLLTRAVQKTRITDEEKASTLNNLKRAKKLEDARTCDLVIEAIVENMDVKTKLFRELDEITRSEEHTSELQSRFDLVCR